MHTKDLQIIEIFKELVSRKVKVYEVRVFGSRARGDAEKESDIDVLVLVEHLDHSTENHISDCAWEAGFEHGIVVVSVVYSRDEWENSPERYSLLAQAIKRDGVLV